MGSATDKPDFSDVQGGASPSTSAERTRADFSDVESQVGSPVDESTNYIVAAGDSLSEIARHFYGNANAWKSIFDANRDQLTDPDRIKPGQILKIPTKS